MTATDAPARHALLIGSDFYFPRQVDTAPNFGRRIDGVAFSPDGVWLAASNRLVRASLDSLLSRAEDRLTRDLNARECKLYLDDDSCPGFFKLEKHRD